MPFYLQTLVTIQAWERGEEGRGTVASPYSLGSEEANRKYQKGI